MDVDQFIADCRDALAEDQAQLAIADLVRSAITDQSAMIDTFGQPENWAITPLYNADDLTILHFVWPPGVNLFPHDHLMWATIGLYSGQEDNAFYRQSEAGLESSGGRSLLAGDVCNLGSAAIHSVHTPSSKWTGAIHVYGGDFFTAPRTEWDAESGDSKPFDIDKTRGLLAAADAAAKAS